MVLASLLVAYKGYVAFSSKAAAARTWQFPAEIEKRVPAAQRIYQMDASGFQGFWSGRTVINGDGLVNDREYGLRLLQGELDGYLEQQKICWIERTPRVAPARKALLLDYRGLQVHKSAARLVYPRSSKKKKGRTQLWKLRRPDCEG